MKTRIAGVVFGAVVIGLVVLFLSWPSRRAPCPQPARQAGVGSPVAPTNVTATRGPNLAPHIAQRSFPGIAWPDLGTSPPGLAGIMGQKGEQGFPARLKAVHDLGQDLPEAEVAGLYSLLYRKKGEDGLPPDGLNALKNDAANALKAQHQPPKDLARHLMSMYYDPTQDAIWRDYCVQHLGSLYAKTADEQEQRWIRDLFWQATEETAGSIAGTALIALSDNAGQPGIGKADVVARALALAQDAKCSETSKTTALQICAELGEAKVLPAARALAASARSIPLRMSAIAVLGTLGGEVDRPVLEGYAAGADGRLRTAARSALSRLGKGR